MRKEERNVEKKERNKVATEKKEINKERDMAARARGMAIAEEDYAKQEASRKNQQQRQLAIEGRKEQLKIQQDQNLQKQITSDIGSLIQSYNQLQISYNDIEKQNPKDPKLRDIFNEMVSIREEIKRLKSQK